VKFLEDYEEERRESDNDNVANTELRRNCYERAATFFHERNWYPQDDPTKLKQAALPSCIVWVIRRKYPDEDGKYSGFPPKSELLWKVVDAQDRFTDAVKVCESIVDMANPKGGLLTTLQRFDHMTLSRMHDAVQQHDRPTSSAADNAERWTQSADKGIQVLPRLGIVECATAFEACVQDAIKCCLDILSSARKVSASDEKSWIPEFKKWSKTRASQSQFWPDEVHESEIRFWADFISELRTRVDHSAAHSKCVLETLQCFPKKVFQQLTRDPTSQNAVGLVQDLLDAKKQEIVGALKCPTFSCIQQTFCGIAAFIEAPHDKAKLRKTHEKSTTTSHERRAKKRETDRKHDLTGMMKQEAESPSVVSSSNTSSGITDTTVTQESSTAEITKPPQSTESDTKSPQTAASAIIEDFLEHLVSDYANTYHWQIWRHGAPKNVKCNSAQSLRYLSNLFYGMRCIFSHGSPRKTIEFGAMGIGRRPSEACDFDIDVVCPGKAKEQRNEDKALCESYLFQIVTDATQRVNEMQVDHDLFKTAQSFYAYAAKIIGSMAASIAYKYSEMSVTETHVHKQEIRDIQAKIDAALKRANEAKHPDAEEMPEVQQESADEWTASSVLPNTSQVSKMDIDTSESTSEVPLIAKA